MAPPCWSARFDRRSLRSTSRLPPSQRMPPPSTDAVLPVIVESDTVASARIRWMPPPESMVVPPKGPASRTVVPSIKTVTLPTPPFWAVIAAPSIVPSQRSNKVSRIVRSPRLWRQPPLPAAPSARIERSIRSSRKFAETRPPASSIPPPDIARPPRISRSRRSTEMKVPLMSSARWARPGGTVIRVAGPFGPAVPWIVTDATMSRSPSALPCSVLSPSRVRTTSQAGSVIVSLLGPRFASLMAARSVHIPVSSAHAPSRTASGRSRHELTT